MCSNTPNLTRDAMLQSNTTSFENLESEHVPENFVPSAEPKKERRRRLLKQLGIVLVATLGQVSVGISHSWPSPALSSIAVDNATLVGTEIVLTKTQMDMTASIMSAGYFVGPWVYGHLAGRIGRVLGLRLFVFPYIIGCIMLAFSPNPQVILTARFILGLACGFGSGMVTMYVAEVSDMKVRGIMLSMTSIAIVVGILYTVSLGYLLPWHYLSLVCALPSFALLTGTFFLPQSPSYLVVRGKKEKAIRVLEHLRGRYADVKCEIAKLELMNAESSSEWRGLLKPIVLKRLLVVVALFFFQNFSGNFVFITQTSRVLRSAGTSLDPDLATVCVGVLRVVGTLISAYIIDKAGRCLCLLISFIINAVSLAILGIFIFYSEGASPEDRMSWVPLVCVSVAVVALSIGAHPVPYILSAEYFPTNIRAKATGACYAFGIIPMFLSLQLYSVMQEGLTQPGLYWFYAAVSCVGILFTLTSVTETKGRHVG